MKKNFILFVLLICFAFASNEFLRVLDEKTDISEPSEASL